MQSSKPKWWKSDYDSGWERVKAAFQRDWEQTKNDFGSKKAPDLKQGVGDTVKQAAGSEPIPPAFTDNESAFRFGYGARQHFGEKPWDDTLERTLQSDYGSGWERDRDYVRRGYLYKG